MLMMQTLMGLFSSAAETGVEIAAHKPAQTKIPVKIPFCGTEVRKRHSNGSGFEWISARLSD